MPRVWTPEELQTQRAVAEGVFRDERRQEGPRLYERTYRGVEPTVRNALLTTSDLHGLGPEVLSADPQLWRVLRYFCAPPISEEDLWTLVGKKFKVLPSELAEDAALAFRDVLDPIRFPWLMEGRPPTEEERKAAILATSGLLAYETLRTLRRGDSAKKQELAVAAVLSTAGYHARPENRPVEFLDEMERGTFSAERKLGGAKCDVPVRLKDGRMLSIECKVSNGPKNSWKRLVREVGGKAETWRARFGTQVVTASVVAGVFDLSCLLSAQNQGVYLFWQHDLDSLKSFLAETG